MPTLTLPFVLAAAASHSFATVAIAILGIGFLIFIHELGHFLACRLTRTRVETFSIGFGPRLFGWEGKPGAKRFTVGRRRTDPADATIDVRIAVVPLGGYVKMAGELGGDGGTGRADGAPRARLPDEFPSKPFGARVLIICAGVIMNFVTAFVFYWAAYAGGILEAAPIVGSVTQGGSAWEAGVLAGDRLVSLDGKKIRSFDDFQQEIAFSDAGVPMDLVVERGGERVSLALASRFDEEIGLPLARLRGATTLRLTEGVATPLEVGPREVVRVNGRLAHGGTQAAARLERAVLDGVTSVAIERVGAPAGTPPVVVDLTGLRARVVGKGPPRLGIATSAPLVVESVRRGGRAEAAGLRAGDAIATVDGRPVTGYADLEAAVEQGAADDGRSPPPLSLGVRRGDATVEVSVARDAGGDAGWLFHDVAWKAAVDVSPIRVTLDGTAFADGTSPAAVGGVRSGDALLAFEGKPVADWRALLERLVGLSTNPVHLTVRTGDEPERVVEVTPKPSLDRAALDETWQLEAAMERVRADSALDAMGLGVTQTVREVQKIFRMIGSFVSGRLSPAKTLGGPGTIVKVSSAKVTSGWAAFLAFLAFISVNLAVLNILPIPVLDGGHLLFLLIEKVRGGRPLKEATIVRFQMIGMLLLLALMFFAIRNDVKFLGR